MKDSENDLHTIIRRPATREDIEAFARETDTEVWPTAKAWVGELDGEIVALGGFALVQGRWIGFVDVTEAGRKLLESNMYVRASFVRAAVEGLREAKRMGVAFVYARADTKHKRAEELLQKLGFQIDPRSGKDFRWSPKEWQR